MLPEPLDEDFGKCAVIVQSSFCKAFDQTKLDLNVRVFFLLYATIVENQGGFQVASGKEKSAS